MPTRQELVQELEALRLQELETELASRTAKNAMPGGVMPGVRDAAGNPISLPGQAPPEVAPMLRPPAQRRGLFGPELFNTSNLRVDETGQTQMARNRAETADLATRIYNNAGGALGFSTRMNDPKDPSRGVSRDWKTPGVEDVSRGVFGITGAIGEVLAPAAVAALLRFPLPTLAGAATYYAGKKAVEKTPDVVDWVSQNTPLPDTNLKDLANRYPETHKLLGELGGITAGGAAFKRLQDALARRANTPNISTEALHRVLSPRENETATAEDSIRNIVPLLKEYSTEFSGQTASKSRNQGLENPLGALAKKVGLSGSSTRTGLIDIQNPAPASVVKEGIAATEALQDDLMSAMESQIALLEQRGVTVSGDDIANAMAAARRGDAMIPQDVGNRLVQVENAYRGRRIPIRQVFAELKDSNQSSGPFYRKNPKAQSEAMTTNAGDAAVEFARGGALREAAYPLLDPQGEGAGASELMRLWGQAKDVRSMLWRKLNPAYKGTDGEGRISAIYHLAKATAGTMTGLGTPLGAAQAAMKAAGSGGNSVDKELLNAILGFEGPKPKIAGLPDLTNPAGIGLLGGATPGQKEPLVTPPPRDVSGDTTGNYPRPGAGYSAGPIDHRLLGPATRNPDPRTGGARVTPPGPGSYPGQEPERGLYRTAGGFTDPFPGVTGHDRSRVLQQLKADGKAEIIVNGQKRMWRLNPDGSIRRLR